MKDGHVNKCKECNKRDVRSNRIDKIAFYSGYDKERGKREIRKTNQTIYRQTSEANFPIRKQATTFVANSLKRGKMVKASCCESCGSPYNIEAHHSSYTKDMWSIVTWLCSKCHGKIHSIYHYDEINLNSALNCV